MNDGDDGSASMWILESAQREAGLAETPKGGIVYHYTDLGGLRGIVANRNIWASDVDFLNDVSEYAFGKEIVDRALAKLQGVFPAEVLNRTQQLLNERMKQRVLAACFSDDDDLLPQWRSYGASGAGFAIGFRFADFAHFNPLFYSVSYGEKALSDRIDRLVAWAAPHHHEAFVVRDIAALTSIASSFGTILLLLIICAKRKVFSCEQEWRWLVMRGPTEDVAWRDRGTYAIPYVELPLPHDGQTLRISSVRCGPTLHDTANRKFVESLLITSGITAPVHNSDALLRF